MTMTMTTKMTTKMTTMTTMTTGNPSKAPFSKKPLDENEKINQEM